MKNLNLIFLGVFGFLFNLTMYAQILPSGVAVNMGPEIDGVDITKISNLLKYTDEGYIAYNRMGFIMQFVHVSNEMEVLKATSIDIRDFNADAYLTNVTLVNSEIVVFTKVSDKENFVTHVYYQKLNESDYTLSTPVLLLSKTTTEDEGLVSCSVSSSEDTRKVVVTLDVDVKLDANENKVEFLDVYLLDENLEVIWQRDSIMMSTDELNVSVGNAKVTNSGLICLNASSSGFESEDVVNIHVNGIADLLSLLGNYQRHVVLIQEDKDPMLYQFKLDAYEIGALDFVIDSDDNVRVVGVYKANEGEERGFYNALINSSTGEFEFENLSVFGDMKGVITANSHYEDTQVAEALRLASNVRPRFTIDHLLPDEDGVTMIGESYFSNYGYGNYYHYGIAVVRFNNNGEIVWQRGIPKIQYGETKSDSYAGYGLIKSGKKLSFVFNFLPLEESNGMVDGKSWSTKKAADIYLAQVGASGEMRIDFIASGGKKPFWKPNSMVLPSNNEGVLLGMDKKKIAFLKIKVSGE